MMEQYQVYPIDSSFLVIVQDRPAIAKRLQTRIDTLWEKAQEKNPNLFNGSFFNVDSFDGKTIVGHFREYKDLMAQRLDPSLQAKSSIHPLAISCFCRQGELILWGQRASWVTEYPNHFELVPSGGIESQSGRQGEIDVILQTFKELKEEAGIEKEGVHSLTHPYLVRDNLSGNYEVCMKVELHGQKLLLPSHEYSKLWWMPETELSLFIQKEGFNILPFSLFLLNLIYV